MDLWGNPKPFAVKEEIFCKNECEVIIDVEENPDKIPDFCFSKIEKDDYDNEGATINNEKVGQSDNNIDKYQRSKVQMRFGCMVCDYKTANSTNFKIHLRTHTGEKPYKCDRCPYRAKVLCALYRHRRVHTGERPYACTECSYRAAQPSHLVRHKLIHTGERPHSCKMCNYRASQMSHLIRHMSVHTNFRPYPCTECPYKAKRKSHLQKHLSTHEKERQNNIVCSRQLRRRNSFNYKQFENLFTKIDSGNSCKFCSESTRVVKTKKQLKHKPLLRQSEENPKEHKIEEVKEQSVPENLVIKESIVSPVVI